MYRAASKHSNKNKEQLSLVKVNVRQQSLKDCE